VLDEKVLTDNNRGSANILNHLNSSTVEMASTSFASLPAEQFDESHLNFSLLAALNGGLKSRATKQLLGRLIETDPSTIRSTIATAIATEPQGNFQRVLLNAVVDFGSSGDVISKSLAQSAHEFWNVLKVSHLRFAFPSHRISVTMELQTENLRAPMFPISLEAKRLEE
jgi:hypothetical protein